MSRRQANRQPTYSERVGQVNGLLDGLAEARLERIARTARRLFGVQGAAILLWRGNRVVYQAKVGAGELPGALVANLAGGPRVLADAEHGLAVVAPLHVDLRLSGGCLCLWDPSQRPFTPDDLESLGDLATWAEHELDVVHLGQTLALRMA